MILLKPDRSIRPGESLFVTACGKTVATSRTIHSQAAIDQLVQDYQGTWKIVEVQLNPKDLSIYNKTWFACGPFTVVKANSPQLPDIDLVAPPSSPKQRPPCECGAAKCGSAIHSSWCPAK